jgi:hypothetical protein
VRQRARRNAEPLICATLRLTELVANHQPIHLCHFVWHGDLNSVSAVALIRWDASGRCVWLSDQSKVFKFGEDATDRCR